MILASWCGPCRAEMPNLVAAYNAFKAKGFGIVGVSLDNNAEAWKKAIKDLNITWAQMSDLKGWSCEGAKLMVFVLSLQLFWLTRKVLSLLVTCVAKNWLLNLENF